jgi:hypothetical protein
MLYYDVLHLVREGSILWYFTVACETFSDQTVGCWLTVLLLWIQCKVLPVCTGLLWSHCKYLIYINQSYFCVSNNLVFIFYYFIVMTVEMNNRYLTVDRTLLDFKF